MNEFQEEEEVRQDEEQSEDAIVQNDFAQTSMPLIQVTDDNLRTYVVCVLTPTNNHPSLCLIPHSNNYCCHDCQECLYSEHKSRKRAKYTRRTKLGGHAGPFASSVFHCCVTLLAFI